MPKSNRGGQNAAPSLDAAPVPPPADPLDLIGDRIDTPDGTNLEEINAAVRKAEEERQIAAVLRSRHMTDCPVFRHKECTCPANLHPLPPVLDRKELANGVEMVRVDDGFMSTRKRRNPVSDTAGFITVEDWNPPRWICTTCGYATRAEAIDGHICDTAQLTFKEKPLPLAYSVPPERRYSGSFRYTVFRDSQGKYHLGEAILEDGRVVHERELFVDGDYYVMEGALADAVIDSFGDAITPPVEDAA